MNTSNKTAIGMIAEEIATKFLKNLGYQIVGRNLNYKHLGELDIVAKDKICLVVVEVKYRDSCEFGHPIESITESKIRKIKKCTEMLAENCPVDFEEIRFDVITVLDDEIEHIIDAFY